MIAFKLLVITCIGYLGVRAFRSKSEEQQFIDTLVNNATLYSPHSNMRNGSVYLFMDVWQLLGIDQKEGTVQLKLWIYVTYYLPHLAWDPVDFGGLEIVTLPADTVWTPDLIFYDATELQFNAYERQMIHYSGMIVPTTTLATMKLTCQQQVKYFPFDTQTCKFTVGQWMNTQKMYRMGADTNYDTFGQMDLTEFKQGGQFELLEPVTFAFSNRTFKNYTGLFDYDLIVYEFRFQRQSKFYVTVILVPCILLEILSIFPMLLPVESGEKISLSVTLLLSQVVQLLVLSDILPPSTSEDFPIIGSLVVFMIIMVSLTVVVSVGAAVLYYYPESKPVPKFLLYVIQSRLMDWLFLERMPSEEKTAKVGPPDGYDKNGATNDGKEKMGLEKLFMKRNMEEKVAEKQSEAAEKTEEEEELESKIDTNGWRLLANLLDQIFAIGYTIALLVGSLYYFCEAKYGA